MRIRFWQFKDHAISHKKGLSKLDLEFLSTLREGDRLILFKNDARHSSEHVFTLARATFKEVKVAE